MSADRNRTSRTIVLIVVVACFLLHVWNPNGLPAAPEPQCLEGPIGREKTLTDYVEKKSTSEFNGVCPMLYPAIHSLVNTGRKALVLYTMTSVTDVYDRQVEIDNFLFFRAHAMMPPNTPTALFSSVDYVIATSDMKRNATGRQDIVQCAQSENVRVLEAPGSPCDLCAQARVINALGGAETVARDYEYVALVNSGTRGPFFTEAPALPCGPPPVTWLDHFALGGEKVYTGAIMTGVVGTGQRPYMTSFGVGFPSSVFPALHPVLMAGCSEVMLPVHWQEFAVSFDAELHTMDNSPWETTQLAKTLKYVRDHPESVKSTPRGYRDAAAKKIDDAVAHGGRMHHQRAIEALAVLAKGTMFPPLLERKMKCVYRSEVQIMNTVLKTKLPPEMGTASGWWLRETSSHRRPKLTAEQRSQLSPVLAGYLHEGHYFAHSLHHRQTVVNMGHGLVFLQPGIDCDLCGGVLPKYGGVAWRSRAIGAPCAIEVQKATMAQQPRRLPPVINVGEILRCPNRGPVKPFRSG